MLNYENPLYNDLNKVKQSLPNISWIIFYFNLHKLLLSLSYGVISTPNKIILFFILFVFTQIVYYLVMVSFSPQSITFI